MRGKVSPILVRAIPDRITPAYAGKSIGCVFVSSGDLGSPPPMRGKVSIIQLPFRLCGITPAYAGKSPLSDHIQNQAWDHPRLCGEKASPIPQPRSGAGSPPPMRGKVHYFTQGRYSGRITPAYAGKSSCPCCTKSAA